MDQFNRPIVSIRFDSIGSRKFADLTNKNVGKRFAIVLDNKVISAPVIQEPIPTGNAQISGNFTFETANDLAILLQSWIFTCSNYYSRGKNSWAKFRKRLNKSWFCFSLNSLWISVTLHVLNLWKR